MVDFKPSTGKRVTVRMPDSPAVSLAQLSPLPAPSEVTMPMPVTTTIGLPNLSRGAVVMIYPINPALWFEHLKPGEYLRPSMTGPKTAFSVKGTNFSTFSPLDRSAETARRRGGDDVFSEGWGTVRRDAVKPMRTIRNQHPPWDSRESACFSRRRAIYAPSKQLNTARQHNLIELPSGLASFC